MCVGTLFPLLLVVGSRVGLLDMHIEILCSPHILSCW